jgi:hypothetical protein
MTSAEKRRRFRELAKQPHVETGRQLEKRHGQLELDFSSPSKVKAAYRRAQMNPQKKLRSQ